MLIAMLILTAIICALWALVSFCAKSHWNASAYCSRSIDEDGIDRELWAFKAAYANTLLGSTVGKFKVARAREEFNRQEKKRSQNLA